MHKHEYEFLEGFRCECGHMLPWNEAIRRLNTFDQLEAGIKHIKAWLNQPVGLVSVQQIVDAVSRMCDDALEAVRDELPKRGSDQIQPQWCYCGSPAGKHMRNWPDCGRHVPDPIPELPPSDQGELLEKHDE